MSTYWRNLKKKTNYGIGILLILITFVSTLNLKLNSTQKSIVFHDNDMKGNIKIANFWSLPFIHVDNNWSLTEQTYDWCTGNGSWSNPYVIENVTINAQNSSNGILIENSNTDYFILRNNTLVNSSRGVSWGDAGIKLFNSQRGTIINNEASFNNGNGILLSNSHNNSIIENTALNNSDQLGANPSGILLQGSDNNTVRMNNASNNLNYGIQLYYGDYNNVFENIVDNHEHYGIVLYHSDNNRVIENNVSRNTDEGILVFGSSDYNLFEDNRVFSNDGDAIDVRYWDSSTPPTFNRIINNVIYDNGVSGINFGFGVNNTAALNEIYNNSNGITLSDSNNSIIYDNEIFDNVFGIDIDNSGSTNNTLYLNYLYNNTNNGRDNGVNNTWDNSVIGNYWGDYIGADNDDDGIGDVPYNIIGSANNNDTLPIWEDGFNGSTILIDDSSSNNWDWAKTRLWCEGSGTINDPYVISGLTIDAKDSGSCIEIRNSIKYFIISGNTLINSSGGYSEAAIKLNNVTNAKLMKNNVSYLNFFGIYLISSNFNLIEENNASDYTDIGILLENSDNNTINKNIVNKNIENGISINDDSDFNNITSNLLIDNQLGIVIYSYGNNNYIFNNTVKFNTRGGVGAGIIYIR